jgi:hypothetical protein
MTPQTLKDFVLQHSTNLVPETIILIENGVRFTVAEIGFHEVMATILLGADGKFYIQDEYEDLVLVYTLDQYREVLRQTEAAELMGISYQHWVDLQ